MKRNDVDPWTAIVTEELEIDGVKVTVRGLTVGELNALSKEKKTDIEQSVQFVSACCERDGKTITEEQAMSYRPDVLKLLNDAVARVNGVKSGNSNATVGGGFSSE